MNFESSLVVCSEIKDEIAKLSLISGKSSCFIVKKIIGSVIKDMKSIDCIDSLTEYQNKHGDFVIFRFRLSKNEHDDFTYARHRFKISISKLLFIGFLLFFDKMIKKYLKTKKRRKIFQNNYTTIFYLFINLVEPCLEIRGINKKKYP